MHIWDWYQEVSRSIRRVRDEVCEPIPPSEFLAWKALTGTIVHPWEYDILRAMDGAYCEEMNKELTAYQERKKAAMEKRNR